MRLNELRDNAGAVKERTRIGRGIGSGKGKTGGRGVKGQKSRSGVAVKGFEGGQMPLHQRLPKRGFTKPNRKQFAEVSLGRLQAAVDAKKLDAKKPVDAAALVAAGVIRRPKDGVRVIGGGELKTKLDLSVAGASKPAAAAVAKAGGSVTVLAAKADAGEAKASKKKSEKK
ncbi:50S ribosomal protein L15 [Marinicauda salina]|uniref:Large ribosomal subunit protein uL15 n=1 Tax=Marinicauda salina TaxID=2135793 RepID=A0A2U2BRB0_9PROT|nr:50S ribosomal protein L15 [Marinicauda salina]PWE16536.1 50S ribosomal protein L15 [Marinicauda salina]